MRRYLTMHSRARSNTALFRSGQRWQRSVLTNRPRPGVRGAMDSVCAAVLPAGGKSFAAGARAVAVASDCSRGRQTLRTGRRAPAAAEVALRAVAAAGNAAHSGWIHLLPRSAGRRSGAARIARDTPSCLPGECTQSHQALYPRGVPPGAAPARSAGYARAPSPGCRTFAGHDRAGAPPAREAGEVIASALRAALRGYRWFISPLLPAACRFHPSCSQYAEEAVQRHGALRGSLLAARRVCRCGPWHPGGFDPVP